MIILGVDPGSRICGYGVIRLAGTECRYLECGVLTAPQTRPMEYRLGEIARGLRELVGEFSPDLMAVEDVFTHANPRASLALAQARGMVLAVAGMAGITVFSYAPAVVKKTVTGRGGAPKQQVARMVQVLVGLQREPRSDASDALAVALTCAMHRETAAASGGAS